MAIRLSAAQQETTDSIGKGADGASMTGYKNLLRGTLGPDKVARKDILRMILGDDGSFDASMQDPMLDDVVDPSTIPPEYMAEAAHLLEQIKVPADEMLQAQLASRLMNKGAPTPLKREGTEVKAILDKVLGDTDPAGETDDDIDD